MRAVLIIAVLVGLGLGAWGAWTYESPVMERDIDARAEAAVRPLARHAVTIATDGRHVTLSGIADSVEERDRLLTAAGVEGHVAVIDRLEILDRADPFSLTVTRSRDGAFSLAGLVPDAAARAALEDEAKRLSTGRAMTSDLALATGAPEGDWQGMALSALRALQPLEEGQVTIDGIRAVVTGLAPDGAALAVAEEQIAQAPLGEWQAEIALAVPLAQPFTYTASKTGGDIRFDGVAPDAAVMTRLRERAVALAPGTAEGTLSIARGMPDPSWPGLVEQGLGALALLDDGRLDVADRQVTLTGEVEDEAARARFAALLAPDWQAEITLSNPAPAAGLEVAFTAIGGEAAGSLPLGAPGAQIDALLPEIDLSTIPRNASGSAVAWAEVLAALGAVAPDLLSGSAEIAEGRLAFSGTLPPGADAGAAETTLRSALPLGWSAEIALAAVPLPDPDAAPSVLKLVKDEAGLTLSGSVPPGTALPDALRQATADLSPTGGGDALVWSESLARLVTLLSAYDSAEGRIEAAEAGAETSSGSLALDGRLAPGLTQRDLTGWAATLLGPDWSAQLTGVETAAPEGATRMNLASGETETLTRGYWLPEVQIAASAETCSATAQAALETERITFLSGSAEIDAEARTLINRLSAVALTCLGGGIELELAGHTDASGDPDANQALSEARAGAVRTALEARGVPSDAIRATGFGAAQPIAENDTEAGRAQNRRIEFRFTE